MSGVRRRRGRTGPDVSPRSDGRCSTLIKDADRLLEIRLVNKSNATSSVSLGESCGSEGCLGGRRGRVWGGRRNSER